DEDINLIPNRFSRRKQQFAALVSHLKAKHPEDVKFLDNLLSEYMEKIEAFYWKAMNIAMLTAVTGGGKAKTGNAPHFTFAAGQDDYTLAATLKDFQRHPVYHIWEFVFSTTYSTVIGPAIAQSMFGQNVVVEAQKMLQRRFKETFPEFERKLDELRMAEGHKLETPTPKDTRHASRREFMNFWRKTA
ncbi:MAG: hypothetical protein O3B47_05830, partial [bacterium]|nr:hypothetical protein [bacterium]